MNRTDDTNGSDRFDAAMRRRHAAAIAAVSPRVHAQLAQRRSAALRGQPRRPALLRMGWPLAASCATVLAIVIGLQIRPETTTPAAATASAATMTTVAQAPVSPELVASMATAAHRHGVALESTLDDSPDFYVWLTSGEADDLITQ